MLDGVYQSVMIFFVTYLLYAPANFVTFNGRDLEDRIRMGVYVAHAAVIVANVYILLNTYRWDWLMLLLSSISVLLAFFWTGVYGASTYSSFFYGSGSQTYGALSFWTMLLLATVICLMPRFAVKSLQKIFFPYDIDIIREQVRQGRFRHLDGLPPDAPHAKLEKAAGSLEEASDGTPSNGKTTNDAVDPKLDRDNKPPRTPHGHGDNDSTRPLYGPPSTAPPSTYQHGGSANGSDSTADTNLRRSLERMRTAPPGSHFTPLAEVHSRAASSVHSRAASPAAGLDPPLMLRASLDRPRPSFDRMRSSLDLVRPSFEQSEDMTTASRLMRVDSRQSDAPSPSDRRSPGPSNLR